MNNSTSPVLSQSTVEQLKLLCNPYLTLEEKNDLIGRFKAQINSLTQGLSAMAANRAGATVRTVSASRSIAIGMSTVCGVISQLIPLSFDR